MVTRERLLAHKLVTLRIKRELLVIPLELKYFLITLIMLEIEV